MSRRRIKRRGRGRDSGEFVLGAAWYSPEQWEKLKQVAADPESIEDSFENWLRVAEQALRDIRNSGQTIEMVKVDVDELVEWCREAGRPIDGSARADFAAELLWRRDNPGDARRYD